MTLCPSCGAENVDGTRFCVKCGAGLSAAPSPGSWQEPPPPPQQSGGLYDTPGGGAYGQSASGGLNQPYQQPVAPPPMAYGYPQGMAVAGGMQYAEWFDRVIAALIDGAMTFAVMIVLYIIFGVVGGGLMAVGGDVGEALGGGIFCIGMLVTFLSVLGVGIYNKVFLVSKRGFSIGQGVMKLKVVDATGNIPQMGTLVIRLLTQVGMSFIPLINIFLVLLDVLWPLWDERKQTLHDKVAGTYVIKTG